MILRELAKQAYAKCEGIDDAVAWVLDALDSDRALRRRLAKPMVEVAVRATIHDVRHSHLRRLKRAPQPVEAIGVLSDAVMDTQMSRPMPDGRVLGDWLGTELMALSDIEWALASGHGKNATYFVRVGKRAGKRRVADALTEKDLQAIRMRVYEKDAKLAVAGG